MAQSVVKKAPQDNNAQGICINNHDGMFLVVAGPGVGKTYTVIKRIQAMIEKGIEPERILCLTFSDTAAREMKSRVGENVNVNVFTYHSFCLEIMDEFSNHFDSVGYKIITDSHKRTLINECIDYFASKGELKAYNNEKNNPYQYTDDILDGIEEIKKNRIKEEALFKYNLHNNKAWQPHLDDLIKEAEIQKKEKNKVTVKLKDEINSLTNKIAKMDELWKFYKLYNQKMKELGYIDFSDMINIVLDAFENPDSPLLELVAEKYDYVIVDEYQDTNTAQNDIVFNLAKHIDNVFVVGDDDQIIYTFQGAHLDTIEKFLHNFDKKVNVLCFDKNYRSTQKILDLACTFAEIQDNGFYKYMATKSGLAKKEKELYETTPAPHLRFISKCKITDDSGNLLTKKLTASNEKIIPLNNPVDFIEFNSSDGGKDNERDYIVQRIIELKQEFEKYNEDNKSKEDFKEKRLSEIAVLTRTNDDLNDFATYLKANGVPVEITGGKNIFEINSVNVLITYLQFLTNPEKYSDKLLSFLLLKPFNIDAKDYKAIAECASHHKSLIDNINSALYGGLEYSVIKEKLQDTLNSNNEDNIKALKELVNNKDIVLYDRVKLEKFIETFNYLQDYITGENYKNALLEIASQTGILKYYFVDDIVNKLENIKGFKKLIDIADAYFEIHKNQGNSFKLFVDYLTNLIEGGIEVRLDKEDKPMNAVQLSTYHSSKGREFEYVFMPFLTKGKWESNSSSYKDLIPSAVNENETYDDIVTKQNQAKFLDNIKLLYVGMTRAKHSLTLSYTKTDDPTYGRLSWFIQQLVDNEKLKGILDTKQDVKLNNDYILPKYEYNYKKEFKDFIISKLPNKFSASGLNCYRNCPKQYFYNYILKLNAESGSMDNASFGTAMHSAFEYTIKEVMDNKKYPKVEDVYNVFCRKLDTLVCDYPENLKKAAKDSIFSEDGYYDKFKALVSEDKINNYEIKAEYKLSYETEIDGHKVILNGFIDRLDKDNSKEGSINYSIYDYKSKAHCASIPPSDNYFYQMAFYKYVFELLHPDSKVVNATFLLPLEADKNHEINLIDKFDKIVKDTDKTVYEVKIEELLNCIKCIYNLEFDVPKKAKCDFCPYKQFCATRTI